MRTRNLSFRKWVVPLLPALLALHCSSETTTVDASTSADVGAKDSGQAVDMGQADSGTVDMGQPDSGVVDMGMADAGQEDEFDRARGIPFGLPGGRGTISPAGDMDMYKFEATEGQWIVLDIEANPNGQPNSVDTVITLYGPDKMQIAENDDAVPRTSTDSELVVRIGQTGTYYVRVQEWSTWAGAEPVGSPAFAYVLMLTEISATGNGITFDGEQGDDSATANMGKLDDNGFGFWMGTFNDSSDIDVYGFTVPPGNQRLFDAQTMPVGKDGYGVAQGGRMWITSFDGSQIIARVDTSNEQDNVAPSLEPGNYQLWVESKVMTSGSNDYYVLKARVGEENPLEMAEMANNALAGAEALTMSTASPRAGFVLADVGMGDVDYFSFDIQANEQVSVVCGSRSIGAGTMGLTAEVRDAQDQLVPMATGTETGTSALFFDQIAVTSTGTYYLRISKAGQDPMVSGQWARCAVRSGVPQ